MRIVSIWGDRVRGTIARQLKHIKHWKVSNKGYDACPYEGEATWCIDLPYEVKGRVYLHGSTGIDYSHLGNWCRFRQGQVIVCENVGATWLDFLPLKDTNQPDEGSAQPRWHGFVLCPARQTSRRADARVSPVATR